MKELGEFMQVADSVRAPQGHSPVFLFENEEQLPYPHSIHEHIRKIGSGRFSHWGNADLLRDGRQLQSEHQ